MDPEVTVRALLKFLTNGELYKLFIIFDFSVGNLVFLAGLSSVKDHSAIEAIVLLAETTDEFSVTFFKEEGIPTAN